MKISIFRNPHRLLMCILGFASATMLTAGETASVKSGPPVAPTKLTFDVTETPVTFFDAWDAIGVFEARGSTVNENHIGFPDLRHGAIKAAYPAVPDSMEPLRYFREQTITSSWNVVHETENPAIRGSTSAGVLSFRMRKNDLGQNVIGVSSASRDSVTTYRETTEVVDMYGGITDVTVLSPLYTSVDERRSTGNFRFSGGRLQWDAHFDWHDNGPGAPPPYNGPGHEEALPATFFGGTERHIYWGTETGALPAGFVTPQSWTETLAKWSVSQTGVIVNSRWAGYSDHYSQAFEYTLELAEEDTVTHVKARLGLDRAAVVLESIPWGKHRSADHGAINVRESDEWDDYVGLYNYKDESAGEFFEERVQIRFNVPEDLRIPSVAYRARVAEIFYPDEGTGDPEIVKIYEVVLHEGNWISPIITPVLRPQNGYTEMTGFSAVSELIQPHRIAALPRPTGVVPVETAPAEYRSTKPTIVAQSQAGAGLITRNVLTGSLTLQQINLGDSWGALGSWDAATAKWSLLPGATAELRLWHWRDDGSALGIWTLIAPDDNMTAYFGSSQDFVFVEAMTGGKATVRITINVNGQEVYDDLLINSDPVTISLAVDANRDGQIKLASEDASDAASVAAPYRFWLNDDNDMDGALGANESNGNDIPGQTQNFSSGINESRGIGADYSTSAAGTGFVDGVRDLLDFFPVYLDLKQLLTVLPTTTPGVKYKLKQADGALNFVYTNKTRAQAFDYQRQLLTTGFSDLFDKQPGEATTHRITAEGYELSARFLRASKTAIGA